MLGHRCGEEKTANTMYVIKLATSVDNWKLISLGNPGSSAQHMPQNYLTWGARTEVLIHPLLRVVDCSQGLLISWHIKATAVCGKGRKGPQTWRWQCTESPPWATGERRVPSCPVMQCPIIGYPMKRAAWAHSSVFKKAPWHPRPSFSTVIISASLVYVFYWSII